MEQKEDQGAASCELQLAQVQEEARLKLLDSEVASRERSRWAQFLLPGAAPAVDWLNGAACSGLTLAGENILTDIGR